jgi:hypothetical protein
VKKCARWAVVSRLIGATLISLCVCALISPALGVTGSILRFLATMLMVEVRVDRQPKPVEEDPALEVGKQETEQFPGVKNRGHRRSLASQSLASTSAFNSFSGQRP